MIRRKRFVPGKAEEVVHLAGFAPAHQCVTAEAGVSAQNDLYLRPALPNLLHDAFDLLQRARASVDVGGPQSYPQQMIAANNVQQQVAVVVVKAVKKALLLMTVHRQIGRIQIDHNLAGRLGMRFQKDLHQQLVYRRAILVNLLVAVFDASLSG